MIRKKRLKPGEVGSRIREIRGEKTLDEFGALLGVKNPTVYRYETDRIPDADMLLKIAALDPLKRGVEWLTVGRASIYKEGGEEKPIAAEAPEDYGGPKRLKLVRAVKKLVEEADDDVIEALLKNVEQFSRIPKKEK
jgi:transcriptional regulator with XRE-family HTH domain